MMWLGTGPSSMPTDSRFAETASPDVGLSQATLAIFNGWKPFADGRIGPLIGGHPESG
jgi:hypothetical protein